MNAETAELLGDINTTLEKWLPDMDWRDRAEIGLAVVETVRRWGAKAGVMKSEDPQPDPNRKIRLHDIESENTTEIDVIRYVEGPVTYPPGTVIDSAVQ